MKSLRPRNPDSYAPAFIGLAVLSLAGSLTALVIQAPEKRVVTTSTDLDSGTLEEQEL